MLGISSANARGVSEKERHPAQSVKVEVLARLSHAKNESSRGLFSTDGFTRISRTHCFVESQLDTKDYINKRLTQPPENKPLLPQIAAFNPVFRASMPPRYMNLIAGVKDAAIPVSYQHEPAEKLAQHLLWLASRSESVLESKNLGTIRELAEELEFVARQLKQCSSLIFISRLLQCLSLPIAWRGTHQMAQALMKRIQKKGRALIPVGPIQHAMLMEIERNEFNPSTYSIRIYNTGLGLTDHHIVSSSGKRVLAYEVKGAKIGPEEDAINIAQLQRLYLLESAWNEIRLRGNQDIVDELYQWVNMKGAVNLDRKQLGQTPQKSSDCSQECLMAWLRQKLPEEAYKHVKATLFDQAIKHCEKKEDFSSEKAKSGGHRDPTTHELLIRRRNSARNREREARARREIVQELKHEPWFLGICSSESAQRELLLAVQNESRAWTQSWFEHPFLVYQSDDPNSKNSSKLVQLRAVSTP